MLHSLLPRFNLSSAEAGITVPSTAAFVYGILHWVTYLLLCRWPIQTESQMCDKHWRTWAYDKKARHTCTSPPPHHHCN